MTVQDEVHQLLAPIVATLSVELFDVEFSGNVLRVIVNEGQGISTDRLAEVNRLISPILDQHDPVPGRYTLEVSSPGLERPLRRPAHFQRAIGEEIVVKMISSVVPRRYRGRLTAVEIAESADSPIGEAGFEPAIGGAVGLAGTITLEAAEIDGVPEAEPTQHQLSLAELATARTVFAWGPGPKPGQPKAGHPKAGPSKADQSKAGQSKGGKAKSGGSKSKSASRGQAESDAMPEALSATKSSTRQPTRPSPSEVCDEQ